MSDIKTVWNVQTIGGDWALSGAALATGDDLVTALLICVFTDRQANEDDEIPDGTNDPRGWWGDLDRVRPIGSRMWLLERAKETQDTLNRAREYLEEACQGLIEDGIAAAVDVFTEWTKPGLLGATITVRRHDGTTIAENFSWAWQGVR